MTITIKVVHTVDENGNKIVQVPVSNMNKVAILDENDFSELIQLGLSPRWNLVMNQVAVRVPCFEVQGCTSVARLVMDAGKGEIVHFLNGDKFDLRRKNLVLAKGQGKYRVRSLITPSHMFTSHRAVVEHVYLN